MTKDTNRNNLKQETEEWKKCQSCLLVMNAGSNLRPSDFTIRSSHFSLMSHGIQWIHKGSSCILLRSSISKFSCLQIHNDRKEISNFFVTKEKIIFNRRPKKINPIRQIRLNDKYQCWHVDKHTRPWGSLFIFPRGIYEIRDTGSMIRSITCLCELSYNYLWSRLLQPNSANNSGAQRDRELGPQISPPT